MLWRHDVVFYGERNYWCGTNTFCSKLATRILQGLLILRGLQKPNTIRRFHAFPPLIERLQ